MTFEIILVFAILVAALVIFFTGWLRMDVVALLVMGVLAFSGLVTPEEAVQGFSNPAVITVWSMFILSAAFSYTGIAGMIGKQIYRLSGTSEWSIILVVMLLSGLLSSLMNNIGVAALLLPVVMDIARSTGRSPSRLLLPLVAGIHLGGLTTLVGTPSNVMVSVELTKAGYEGLDFLDFIPMGMAALFTGTFFVILAGRFLLRIPEKSSSSKKSSKNITDLKESYQLLDRTFTIKVPQKSYITGKTLAQCKMRSALGINVLSIQRANGETEFNPGPDTIIHDGDHLFVQGRHDALQAFLTWKSERPEPGHPNKNADIIASLPFFEIIASDKTNTIGKPAIQQKYPLTIIAHRQGTHIKKFGIVPGDFNTNDIILVQTTESVLREMDNVDLIGSYQEVNEQKLRFLYRIDEFAMVLQIDEPSELLLNTAGAGILSEGLQLTICGISKNDGSYSPAIPVKEIHKGDKILIIADPELLHLIKGLLELEIEEEHNSLTENIEKSDFMIAEAVLAPRSVLAGKTLREINFRKKYGLTVLALWREGRAFRTNIHTLPLRFGEALLLYGKRSKIMRLDSESDFILLTDTQQTPLRTQKGIIGLLIMASVLAPVILGIMPIEVTSIVGVALMVLTGCLTMEEAYKSIQWKSVFLIAGMLPLGVAMQKTGAALVLSQGVEYLFGYWDSWGIIAGLYLTIMALTLALHPAAIVVIMSPVVLQLAAEYQISPQSLMIMTAIASTSLISPVSHPANLLIMGPGGYKFSDFIRFGLPLAIVIMVMVFALMPVVWGW